MVCGQPWALTSVTFEVLCHLFVVVYGCVSLGKPKSKLANTACAFVLGELVLWLPRVTFEVVFHLFVVVCGRGPLGKP